ncbi:uncharacterized protein LOC122955031 [Acropora millepora]|uniref:uncharacterized protein LOC122955031 n=1 Tax=Acropora millepora TaxID=45264 RepID=UPI001CF5A281|nr:uncharacterized protein LOC122955031 [Acropora millepora]
MTTPRLELMCTIPSSRLAQNILKMISVNRITVWTDSQNVWHWVRNQSREFKPSIANRIGKIQRTTSPEQWRHVPGTVNPADLPTRGLSAVALAESEVWMEGPAFLKKMMIQPGQQLHPLDTTLRRMNTANDKQQPEHT